MSERETLTATAQIQEFSSGKTPNNKVWQKVKTDKGQFKSWGRKPDLETWDTDVWVRFTYFEGDEWEDQHGNKRRDRIVIKAEGPVEAPTGETAAAGTSTLGTGQYIAARENPEKQRAIWASVALEQARASFEPFPSEATPKKIHERVGVLAQAFFQTIEQLAALPEPPKAEEKPAGGGGLVDESDIPFERTL